MIYNNINCLVTIESENLDFHSFLVTVERDCLGDVNEDCSELTSPDQSGSLQLLSQDENVTFHPECINTIIQSESGIKMRKLRFMWVAPKIGNNCVYIRQVITSDKASDKINLLLPFFFNLKIISIFIEIYLVRYILNNIMNCTY